MDIPVPQTLYWQNNQLHLLDQRVLPHKVTYLSIDTLTMLHHAIKTLCVRGAPAIGVAAAYGLAQSMFDVPKQEFVKKLQANTNYLISARPTAVNLAWASHKVAAVGHETQSAQAMLECAKSIHQQDINISLAIGQHGAGLIETDSTVLTHCNAGSLAVARYGTATAPMYTKHARGEKFHVLVDETRPLYQGARLTAWELSAAGIDVTLICDNMAATHMSQKQVNCVMVGTDRVTQNGDVINKIGTLNLAILCHHFDIPFYVACPSSTYDNMTPNGDAVTIEQRNADEVIGTHAAKVNVANPAFDVTPAHLVTSIITEHGVHKPQALVNLFK